MTRTEVRRSCVCANERLGAVAGPSLQLQTTQGHQEGQCEDLFLIAKSLTPTHWSSESCCWS